MIINLVINAVEAMEGSGKLGLKTYADRPTGRTYLEIADTGSGISQENISKIFDPFFPTRTVCRNTGLGLSTAYGIVTRNRGNISVKSTSSAGTTFLLEFPLFDGECAEDESPLDAET